MSPYPSPCIGGSARPSCTGEARTRYGWPTTTANRLTACGCLPAASPTRNGHRTAAACYLLLPDDPGQRGQIHEFTPDTNEDKMVAPTSRFVRFSANADAAVFVGSSASKAAPHVLLLLRSVKRELTICEHRASDPAAVAPVFSPNSQRVFFVSDQHGKPAIYTMSVERLVEET